MWMFFSGILAAWVATLIGSVILLGWILFDRAFNRPSVASVAGPIDGRQSAMMGFGFFILIVGMLGEWAVQWAFPEFASYFPKISFSFLP